MHLYDQTSIHDNNTVSYARRTSLAIMAHPGEGSYPLARMVDCSHRGQKLFSLQEFLWQQVSPALESCHALQSTTGSLKKATPSFVGELKKVSKEVMVKIPNRALKYRYPKIFGFDIKTAIVSD